MKSNLDTAKKLIFDRREYYGDLTRKVRWIVIVLVGITYPYGSFYTLPFIGLIVSAIIYNLGWYSDWLRKQPWFGSFISMNLTDNLFVAVLIVMSGGFTSPYYLLFSFMAITASYWFGRRGLVMLAAFHVFFAMLLWQFTDTGIVDIDIARIALVLITTFIINGILAERLTYSDRKERSFAVKVNQEIETERQRLMSLINSIGDGVIGVNKHGEILIYNGAALDLLDTNDKLIGQQVSDYLKLRDEDGNKVDIMRFGKKSQSLTRRRDLIFKASDKSTINIDMTLSPIMDSRKDGAIEGGFIIILRDITKEKSLDEARDEFVSVTSHELRTPIAITEANLSTALLPDFEPDNPKTKDLLEKAHENVVFLSDLVNDLSVLAKAERGILDVDLSMVDPTKLVKELAEDYKDKAKEKGLKLKTEINDDIKPILTSESHIREILQNYIVNALKYTRKGSITLCVTPDENNSDAVVFAVKDTGIGISSTDKKHIYDKFYRSEDYRTRETGGTGLGLYVTKKLAERLSGETWFESELDKGSTFYLKVPPVTKNEEDRSQVANVQVDDFVSSL